MGTKPTANGKRPDQTGQDTAETRVDLGEPMESANGAREERRTFLKQIISAVSSVLVLTTACSIDQSQDPPTVVREADKPKITETPPPKPKPKHEVKEPEPKALSDSGFNLPLPRPAANLVRVYPTVDVLMEKGITTGNIFNQAGFGLGSAVLYLRSLDSSGKTLDPDAMEGFDEKHKKLVELATDIGKTISDQNPKTPDEKMAIFNAKFSKTFKLEEEQPTTSKPSTFIEETLALPTEIAPYKPGEGGRFSPDKLEMKSISDSIKKFIKPGENNVLQNSLMGDKYIRRTSPDSWIVKSLLPGQPDSATISLSDGNLTITPLQDPSSAKSFNINSKQEGDSLSVRVSLGGGEKTEGESPSTLAGLYYSCIDLVEKGSGGKITLPKDRLGDVLPTSESGYSSPINNPRDALAALMYDNALELVRAGSTNKDSSKFSKAVEFGEDAVDLADNANTKLILGKALVETGSPENLGPAIKALSESHKLDPNRRQTLLGLGVAHHKKGDLEQSSRYFGLALTTESTTQDDFLPPFTDFEGDPMILFTKATTDLELFNIKRKEQGTDAEDGSLPAGAYLGMVAESTRKYLDIVGESPFGQFQKMINQIDLYLAGTQYYASNTPNKNPDVASALLIKGLICANLTDHGPGTFQKLAKDTFNTAIGEYTKNGMNPPMLLNTRRNLDDKGISEVERLIIEMQNDRETNGQERDPGFEYAFPTLNVLKEIGENQRARDMFDQITETTTVGSSR